MKNEEETEQLHEKCEELKEPKISGNEGKLLNLIVEIIVKILLKEVK